MKNFLGESIGMNQWLRYQIVCLLYMVPFCFWATYCNGESDDDFFESRIRPVLVKHCLECHGQKKQEGGLRLDSRDGWMRGGDRGETISVGQAEKSLLIQAIRHEVADLMMPPNAKKLASAEIADLEAWINRGAHDPRRETVAQTSNRMNLDQARTFWSFQPVQQSVPPKDSEDRWSWTSIDAFLHAKWKEKETMGSRVSPVSDADRRTLIRRASFDLTGLPPSPEEISTFLSDESEGSFGRLVDRLLESPAYGERWGRHWLDVARYADTAGDGADYPVREAGKYRNWVINAFNRDQPLDEFIREQIAGDILAQSGPVEKYADRVTATGFLAIGKRYGYKAAPDYQYLDFADAIDSIGRSVLGLSVGCARCHDHKYDPITAADYYAWYGILESTRWAFPGGEEQKRPAHFPALIPADEVAKREKIKADELDRIDQQIAVLKRERTEIDPNRLAGGVDLGLESQQPGKPPEPPWLSAGPNAVLADAQSPFAHVHPAGKQGVRIGSGQPTEGVRYVFENGLRATPEKKMHFTVDFRAVEGATEKGAFRFYLGRGVIESLAVECSVTSTEFAIRNGDKWQVLRQILPGTWYTLRLTLDPSAKSLSGLVGTLQDQTAFQNIQTGPNWDGVVDCFICDGIGHVPGAACARDLDNLGLQDTAFGALDSGPVHPIARTPEMDQRMAKLDADIKAMMESRQLVSNSVAYPVAYGVTEGATVNSRIQLRGEPHRLSDEIPRRNLEVLGGEVVPAQSGSGRLELANWLTRPTNPLTARVFVNRVWQWHFGQGLVASPSDFGSRGEPPTHPELLDWLANEFMASGWSVKSLHRSIMNSRAYQLASVDQAENIALDPSNRLHWRFSRRGLDAESIRDAMLAVSGRLDRNVPESHPFPSVDTWGYTIHSPFHAVYDSNHRSVYLMVQRNRRHPYLALFDAADPNQSIASRQPTTTPTQALYLMNSPLVHDASEGFARRVASVQGDDAAKLRWAFEAAHGQIPEDAVVHDAIAFVSAYRKKLAGSQATDESDIAAWSALARVLMTSNAFLYVD